MPEPDRSSVIKEQYQMVKTARSRAEEQFAKLQKQRPDVLSESEVASAELGAKMARLKALRRAKEAADKDDDTELDQTDSL